MKRSYVSGSEKRKKQKEDEEKRKKYSGSLCTFLTAKGKDKVPPPNADNENWGYKQGKFVKSVSVSFVSILDFKTKAGFQTFAKEVPHGSVVSSWRRSS
ncbi:hypothetical protein AAFF_G00221550 [Aldrovandia affinis]|uniref:Uncharacterized protein n=1 Tax=Aldrovandia affinis TaxID=143900 RepID=A0AAD7RG13_9TELE|nr:hypothetical protein AAFF_G00221550 [Aldrovandia affinis]